MNEYSIPDFYYQNIPTQESLNEEDFILISSSKEKTEPSYKVSQIITPTEEFTKKSPALEEVELEIDPFKYLSPKHIFLDEYCRNAIKSGKDIKNARQEASKKWKKMNEEEKDTYEKLAHDLDENFQEKQKYKNLHRINSFNLFIKDELAEARNNNRAQTIPVCAKLWEKASPKIKEQYEKYASIIRDEYSEEFKRKIITDEDSNNILKLSWGPFRFFLLDAIKNDVDFINRNIEVDNIHQYAVYASQLWQDLSDEEREEYRIQASDEKYAYICLKWEFVFNERRKNKKPRSAFIIYANELKFKADIKDLRRGDDFDFFYQKWSLLKDEEKLFYKKAADKEKIDYQEEMTERIKKRQKYYQASIKEKQVETTFKPTKRKHIEEENIGELNFSKKAKYINKYERDKYNN